MHYSEGAYWRPLFEQDMEILQVATGCSWDACRFCDMYHKGFHPSPMKEIEEDIDELAHLWRVPPRIFLGGGNAFHLDTAFLLDVLALIHRKLPCVQSVGCFARIDDIAQKSDEDISALLAQGMDLISIGAESGYDPALASMHKASRPKTSSSSAPASMQQACAMPASIWQALPDMAMASRTHKQAPRSLARSILSSS